MRVGGHPVEEMQYLGLLDILVRKGSLFGTC